jgi:hypothetical protein
MIPVLVILIILISPVMSFAEDATSGYVQVTLEYKSMFPGKIQVVDGVCRQSRSIDCAMASIKVNGETCKRKNMSAECKEARALLDTSFCIEGLIYENRTSRGEKILLNLCTSDAGFGNMLVRDVDKGSVWTTYFLLNEGQAVSYP